MTTHTIVAVYDTPAHAELAIADLTAAGIPASSIQHYAGDSAEGALAHDETESKGGFWAWLTGEETTSEHHAVYDHSMRSGSTVVTVVAEDHDSDKISTILEDHAPIDLEERASQYAGASSMSTASTGYTAPATAAATATGEEALSLSEETLQVGKRAVDAGSTRIRRYTVERPVSEQVQLRDETVSVFRRPATGAAVSDAFTDKTIEMKQTREEAVVGKTAHVVEEVVLQKGTQERVETIHDTVRKEEVEVVGPHGDSTLPVR